MGKFTISMAIFNCYVSSPEATQTWSHISHVDQFLTSPGPLYLHHPPSFSIPAPCPDLGLRQCQAPRSSQALANGFAKHVGCPGNGNLNGKNVKKWWQTIFPPKSWYNLVHFNIFQSRTDPKMWQTGQRQACRTRASKTAPSLSILSKISQHQKIAGETEPSQLHHLRNKGSEPCRNVQQMIVFWGDCMTNTNRLAKGDLPILEMVTVQVTSFEAFHTLKSAIQFRSPEFPDNCWQAEAVFATSLGLKSTWLQAEYTMDINGLWRVSQSRDQKKSPEDPFPNLGHDRKSSVSPSVSPVFRLTERLLYRLLFNPQPTARLATKATKSNKGNKGITSGNFT